MTRKMLLVLAIVALASAGGCVSKADIYEDVAQSRRGGYQRWQQARQLEAQGQTRIEGGLNLADAMKLGLQHNKQLAAVLQEIEAARGTELASRSAILPQVSVGAAYVRLDEAPRFSDADNFSVDLTISQPIFAGGAISSQLQLGKLSRLMADQTVRQTYQDVIYQLALSYYNVLLNQHMYEISVGAVAFSQANLESVQQRRAVGVASNFDVLRAQVELSNFQADLIRNRNAISVSKARLLNVMGVSQDSEVHLTAELEFVPVEANFADAVREAFHSRPELFLREMQVRAQQENLDIAKSRYWPTVGGFYTNEWARPNAQQLNAVKWGHAWRAGLSARYDLFTGFAREGAVAEQRARLRQAEIGLIDAQEQAMLLLREAIVSIEDAEEFVQSQRLNLQRAEEGLRLAEIGYREGINTQVEVLDARAALTRARSLHYEAIYSHTVAKLALLRAQGVLDIENVKQHN